MSQSDDGKTHDRRTDSSGLVQSHFASLARQADTVLERFYGILFSNHPQGRPLFDRVDMDQQRGHLKAALILAMDNLNRPDALEPVLMELGRRHADHGVQPEHYPMIADSLIAALREVTGKDWTPQMEEAWSGVLGQVASTMITGHARS